MNQTDFPKMEKSYQFFQRCRDYIYSFIECYNEKVTELTKLLELTIECHLSLKMVSINQLEDRWLQLYQQRMKMMTARRQEDYKDQDKEYSTSALIEILSLLVEETIRTYSILFLSFQAKQLRSWLAVYLEMIFEQRLTQNNNVVQPREKPDGNSNILCPVNREVLHEIPFHLVYDDEKIENKVMNNISMECRQTTKKINQISTLS